MTVGISTVEPNNLFMYVNTEEIIVTGPVDGVWTITVPDTISQGELDSAIAVLTAEATAIANRAALIAKGYAAQTSNATYLAITTPTNAQVVAQSKAQTRQLNALIKLAIDDLSNTTGT